jgi:hypothetical protein
LTARINDVVETRIDNPSPAARRGVRYSAVVQGRATEFLDLDELLRAEGVVAGDGATP